jgi:hypothetical protein
LTLSGPLFMLPGFAESQFSHSGRPGRSRQATSFFHGILDAIRGRVLRIGGCHQ